MRTGSCLDAGCLLHRRSGDVRFVRQSTPGIAKTYQRSRRFWGRRCAQRRGRLLGAEPLRQAPPDGAAAPATTMIIVHLVPSPSSSPELAPRGEVTGHNSAEKWEATYSACQCYTVMNESSQIWDAEVICPRGVLIIAGVCLPGLQYKNVWRAVTFSKIYGPIVICRAPIHYSTATVIPILGLKREDNNSTVNVRACTFTEGKARSSTVCMCMHAVGSQQLAPARTRTHRHFPLCYLFSIYTH